jgi:co-chaperonin GroES (HSP10)
VIAVGPGKMVSKEGFPARWPNGDCKGPTKISLVGERLPCGLRPGDRVIYLHWKGQDRYAQPEKYGEKLLILDADDVLARVVE